MVILPEKHAGAVHAARLVTYPEGEFSGALGRAWNEYDGLVMVMAAGIVVRHIGTLCRSKSSDPAVVVCDEAGNYAVSLLSGHLGGANRLAADVARITAGRAGRHDGDRRAGGHGVRRARRAARLPYRDAGER